jgi:hypothetical protein
MEALYRSTPPASFYVAQGRVCLGDAAREADNLNPV